MTQSTIFNHNLPLFDTFLKKQLKNSCLCPQNGHIKAILKKNEWGKVGLFIPIDCEINKLGQ